MLLKREKSKREIVNRSPFWEQFEKFMRHVKGAESTLQIL